MCISAENKYMHYRSLAIIAFLLTTNTIAQAEKIPLGSKYFCVVEEGEYQLLRGKKSYTRTEANAIISGFEKNARELQMQGLADEDPRVVTSGIKLSVLAFNVGQCIDQLLQPAIASAPDFEIHDLDRAPHPAFEGIFTRFIDVFGIKVYATDDADTDKFVHVAHILAEYLDNNENGIVDNQEVVTAMRKKQAAMIVFDNPNSADYENFFENFNIPDAAANLLVVGEVHTDQIDTNSAAYEDGISNRFDATLEEVFHLITHEGYNTIYKKIFGENSKSTLGKAMDAAIANGYYNPDANSTQLEYNTKCTEYFYWVMTSMLGAQDYESRAEAISNEWSLNTRDQVQEQDPVMFELLSNPIYGLPERLPDGDYSPQMP